VRTIKKNPIPTLAPGVDFRRSIRRIQILRRGLFIALVSLAITQTISPYPSRWFYMLPSVQAGSYIALVVLTILSFGVGLELSYRRCVRSLAGTQNASDASELIKALPQVTGKDREAIQLALLRTLPLLDSTTASAIELDSRTLEWALEAADEELSQLILKSTELAAASRKHLLLPRPCSPVRSHLLRPVSGAVSEESNQLVRPDECHISNGEHPI
jgi:hypothetical protein